MFWWRHKKNKPFKATPEYLPTIQILFETFLARVEIRNTHGTCDYGRILMLFREKIKLRDPTCDVSCISTIIQDGGQLNISNQNMSRNNADIRIL